MNDIDELFMRFKKEGYIFDLRNFYIINLYLCPPANRSSSAILLYSKEEAVMHILEWLLSGRH